MLGDGKGEDLLPILHWDACKPNQKHTPCRETLLENELTETLVSSDENRLLCVRKFKDLIVGRAPLELSDIRYIVADTAKMTYQRAIHIGIAQELQAASPAIG